MSLSLFSRAHISAARLTLTDVPAQRMLMLQLPEDISDALTSYAREVGIRRETITLEALRAYLGNV